MKIKRKLILPILVLGISILLTSCQFIKKEPKVVEDPASSQYLLQETSSIQPADQDNPIPPPAFVKDHGPAPEIQNDTWLNTIEPLRLADLKGKVVLLEMWTYGWINCQRVIPSLRDWHETYQDQGLVVIGNHYPEFQHERDLNNLIDAMIDLGVVYPVVQDNEGLNWRAYNNRYWPTLYLIDKNGQIRYFHIGEGDYQETEQAIQYLLQE